MPPPNLFRFSRYLLYTLTFSLSLSGAENIFAASRPSLSTNQLSDVEPVVTKIYEPFEKVIKHFSLELEQHANYLIIVNTANPVVDQSMNRDFIRPQHMIVIERKSTGPLLPRKANGEVDVAALQAMQPTRYNIRDERQRLNAAHNLEVDQAISNSQRNIFREVPISSGLRNPYEEMIQTFTGIFRVNATRAQQRFDSNPDSAMSHSLYVDHVYAERTPRESGLAVHGVPNSWVDTLGFQRASEGCIRTMPNIAKELYERIMKNPVNFPAYMPYWDRTQVTPDVNAYMGRPKNSIVAPCAYIILFDRFDGSENTPRL